MLKRILAISLCVLMLFPLASCDKKRGVETDLGFHDPNTDITYVSVAPFGLYASVPKENHIEEYITVGKGESKTVYYRLMLEDPKEFLCIEDSGEYLLVRNEKIEEPTIETFNPVAAEIYSETNTVKVTTFYADEEYIPDDISNGVVGDRDSALCQSIANALTEGEDVSVENISRDEMFYIRLLSKDYPGLYFAVVFFGNGTGRYYLRDRSTGKTVVCPSEVTARMVGDQ